MIEKMNIFDVEIPILTAKEAMIRAMQYLESESVDTIELVSMDMLMKERENARFGTAVLLALFSQAVLSEHLQ